MFHSKKDKAMKKTYITPSVDIIKLNPKTILTTSTLGVNQESVSNVEGSSRDGFGFGDDEE